MKSLVEELKDKTYTQLKKDVLKIIDNSYPDRKEAKISKHNKIVNKRRDELNNQLNQTFKDKMKSLLRFRRLRKI